MSMAKLKVGAILFLTTTLLAGTGAGTLCHGLWPGKPLDGSPLLAHQRLPEAVPPKSQSSANKPGSKGEVVESLDGPAPKPWQASFPLATVWSTLKPGPYEARICYSFPGDYQKGWWRGTAAEWDSFWKGEVLSGPVTLEILTARPKTDAFLLPKRLRLLADGKIGYTRKEAEKVEVKVRNGFFIGTSISRSGGAQGPGQQREELNYAGTDVC